MIAIRQELLVFGDRCALDLVTERLEDVAGRVGWTRHEPLEALVNGARLDDTFVAFLRPPSTGVASPDSDGWVRLIVNGQGELGATYPWRGYEGFTLTIEEWNSTLVAFAEDVVAPLCEETGACFSVSFADPFRELPPSLAWWLRAAAGNSRGVVTETWLSLLADAADTWKSSLSFELVLETLLAAGWSKEDAGWGAKKYEAVRMRRDLERR